MANVELQGEPGTGAAEDIINRLLPAWWEQFAIKNTAYGPELARGGGLGIKAFIPEMNRKMQGIINQLWHDQPPHGVGEDAREKAIDLIGHLFLLVHNLDLKADRGPLQNLDAADSVSPRPHHAESPNGFGKTYSERLKEYVVEHSYESESAKAPAIHGYQFDTPLPAPYHLQEGSRPNTFRVHNLRSGKPVGPILEIRTDPLGSKYVTLAGSALEPALEKIRNPGFGKWPLSGRTVYVAACKHGDDCECD